MARVSAIARVRASDSDGATGALRRDGVVAVEALWRTDAVDALRDIVTAQHPEFDDPERLTDYLGEKNERFIAPVALTESVRASGIFDCPQLEAICAAMLGADFVYEAFGMLMVRPGVAAQDPHRDGGSLFFESGIDRILPPSALTIAFPLVDVNTDFAPTGALPRSHRHDESANLDELVPIALDRGSAAIWDFRTLHAGLANRTVRARPALYLTACRPFWIDHLNFRKNARAKLVGDPEVTAALGPRFVRARPLA